MKLGIIWGLLVITITSFAADLSETNPPPKQRSIWDIFTTHPKTNIGDQVISSKATNATIVTNITLPANLSVDQISAGLKEAISTGLTRAIASLGRTNGFLTNAAVRIPMPQNLVKIEQSMRKLGQDALADEFITAMNRAAEQAVPAATEIFVDSLKQMTITDAQSLLTSQSKTAATEFFRRTTTNQLTAKFLPIVQNATTNAGVTRAYKDLLTKAPVLTKIFGNTNPDIDQYITGKSLDGLFMMIAEEEKRIRENPQARVTALLEKVFGAISKQTGPNGAK
jgi:hypothetical protein